MAYGFVPEIPNITRFLTQFLAVTAHTARLIAIVNINHQGIITTDFFNGKAGQT